MKPTPISLTSQLSTSKFAVGNVSLKYEIALPMSKSRGKWHRDCPTTGQLNEAQLPHPRHAIAMDKPGFKPNGF
jgi:hypothetical protein